jgi:hypothetical protein
MKPELNKALKEAKSFNEIVKAVNIFYDLDKPLGIAGKAMITGSLNTILKAINAQERK